MNTHRIQPATVNGLSVEDLDTLIPPTYPDGYTAEQLGYSEESYDSEGPVTIRSPQWNAPSFGHWPEEETCAPSSAGLCSATC